MITATAPAYCEQINIDEIPSRPRGASGDSAQLDQYFFTALQFLKLTPRQMLADDEVDDFSSPGLKRIGPKRVRVNYRGKLSPLPLDEDIDDQ